MSLFDDLSKFVGEFGDLAKQSVETYGAIIGAAEDQQNAKPVGSQAGVIDRNLSARDFAFQPNWYLVGLGVVILAVVFWSKK